MNVSETSGDGEVWRDWGESLVDGKDILWLGVERVVVNILVVDTIFLTTSDADFLQFPLEFRRLLCVFAQTHHLEPLLHWCSALQVLSGGLDVPVDLLLAQIDHVAGEQRLAVLLEVLLISIQKTIQPWKKLLGAVIGVQDNWDTVGWCNGTDVVSTGDTSSDRSLLLAIGNTLIEHVRTSFVELTCDCIYLSGEVCGTTLGHLEDDRRLSIASSLERSNDGRGRGDVLQHTLVLAILRSNWI